jgi:hypothetical protein
MIALSIRQPWAWCIAHGFKPVENRTWATQVRGRILIHAGQAFTRPYFEEVRHTMPGDMLHHLPSFEDLQVGGIVGMTTIADCVTDHPSPWFNGPFGFVCEDSKPMPFQPVKGRLGFFDVPGVFL